MKTEKQPHPCKKNYPKEQKLWVKVIVPLAIPLLGFVNIDCATKKDIRQLLTTIEGQKDINNSQTDAIIGVKNRLTETETRTETGTKTQLENQSKIDTAQDERIDTISQNDTEKKEEIKRLETAIDELRQLNNSSSEMSHTHVNTDRQTGLESVQTDQNLDVDLELQQAILSLLEEYYTSLVLLPYFQTALETMEDAEKERHNILKRLLTYGQADSVHHYADKNGRLRTITRHVIIPKGKTFSFEDVLQKIEGISPERRKLQIEELIHAQKLKVQEMEEAEKNPPISSQLSDDSSSTPVGPILRKRNEGAAKSDTSQREQTSTIPSANPQIIYIQEKDYTPLDHANIDELELVPLAVIQTGKGKYKNFDLDLEKLPSNNALYAFVIYGVRGIVTPSKSADKQKRISFENDIVIIETQQSNKKCEIRLTDGMIYLFDISIQADKNKLNSFVQSRLDEETDMHSWPKRKADKVSKIRLNLENAQ